MRFVMYASLPARLTVRLLQFVQDLIGGMKAEDKILPLLVARSPGRWC